VLRYKGFWGGITAEEDDMSLSLRERRTLSRIGKAVGESDPRLNSMLAAFSSFNAGESKPRWEQLRLTPRRMLTALRPGVSAARGR
jgi:hypothetical protein